MKLMSETDVRQEMEKAFASEELDRCAKDGLLDDYVRIAAMLTDEEACNTHLLALNKTLKTEAANHKIVASKVNVLLHKEMKGQVKVKIKEAKDVTEAFDVWSRSEQGKAYHVKFNGLLSSVLQKQEEAYCFNGVGPTKQNPGLKTTLTGFVKADDFTNRLLKQGLHWKDPGARLTHGEFTHRLQWWILMRERTEPSGEKYKLGQDLTTLYTSLPNYKMPNGKLMWDFLFDCFTNQEPKSDAFRTPDVLHAYLLDGKNVKLDLLGSVIRARHNKRQFMENRVVDGSAYEAYISWKVQASKDKKYDTQQLPAKILQQQAA